METTKTKKELSVTYTFKEAVVTLSLKDDSVKPYSVDLNELSEDVRFGLMKLGLKTKTRNHRCGEKLYGIDKFNATVESAKQLEDGNYNLKTESNRMSDVDKFAQWQTFDDKTKENISTIDPALYRKMMKMQNS